MKDDIYNNTLKELEDLIKDIDAESIIVNDGKSDFVMPSKSKVLNNIIDIRRKALNDSDSERGKRNRPK